MKNECLLHSMTGFGQSKLSTGSYTYEIEIRSVNHRYLELSLKLPKHLSAFEFDLRALLTGRLRRGKVDLSVSRRSLSPVADQGSFDQGLFNEYLALYRRELERGGCEFESAKKEIYLDILRRSELFRVQEDAGDLEAEKAILFPAVEDALGQMIEMRRVEGSALACDIEKRLKGLRELHAGIKEAAKGLPEKFRERIYSRVKKLEPDIVVDESRLAAELVLYCDRADVTEELVRLASHFTQFEAALSTEGQGRKLDFVVQEFLREFNTIASKAQDAVIQAMVVEAKTEIEKLKEQIQNIE